MLMHSKQMPEPFFSQKSEKHDKTPQYYPLAYSTELETNQDPSGVDEQKLRMA